MNWGEIKNAAFSKLEIDDRDNLDEYEQVIIHAANEAISLLMLVTQPLKKLIPISARKGESFEIKKLASDFYEVITVLKTDEEGELFETLDYSVIDDIFIRFDDAGEYVILYSARPEEIKNTTRDDFELIMDIDAQTIIPLYIASQIYKHDNTQLSIMWRNEFEAARQELGQKFFSKRRGKVSFA